MESKSFNTYYFGKHEKIIDPQGAYHQTRSVLEIKCQVESADSLPDAIFILSNPGGNEYDISEYPKEKPSTCNSVVIPDRVIFRIKDLMLGLDWKHVRVINLSDLKYSTKKDFHKALADFGGDDAHSLFSASRSEELQTMLQAKRHTPIIKAWGEDLEIRGLAKQANRVLPTNAIGIPHPIYGWAYKHPLQPTIRQKTDWLKHTFEQVEEWYGGHVKDNLQKTAQAFQNWLTKYGRHRHVFYTDIAGVQVKEHESIFGESYDHLNARWGSNPFRVHLRTGATTSYYHRRPNWDRLDN